MKESSKMMDNRKVKSDRQAGISRVIQRKGDMEKGQGGKMHNKGEANWKRTGGGTPRKA